MPARNSSIDEELILAIQEMKEKLSTLEAKTQMVEIENAELRTQVESGTLHRAQLQAQIESTSSQTMLSPPPADTNNHTGGKQRLPDPAPFKGRSDDIRMFLRKVDNVLIGEFNSFPTDSSKVSYLASLLEGDAYLWYSNELEANESNAPLGVVTQITPPSYEEIKSRMFSAFRDSNEEAVAERKLANLRQDRGSAQNYSIKFRQLAYRTAWNEATRINVFRQGLSPGLQDKLSTLDDPASLDSFIQQAITVDNRMFKNRVGPTNRFLNPTNPSSLAPPRSVGIKTAAPSNTNPTTRRGPLDPEERKRRLDHNLCLYAGCEGHTADNCPMKKRTQTAEYSESKNY